MNWILFILIVQIIHFLGTWKLYQKAGRQGWEAAVPVYNAFVLTKIINRPWWWVILLFIPIINLMIFPSFWVETVRSFGKEKTTDVLLAVFTLGFYIYYLNYVADVQYKKERQLAPYTKAGEWVTSIVFAVVAATLVHTYFMRPYTIPTSSLEKSLLVGDYLFVSKFHYGARVPMTPLALPMVHDTMPFPKKFRSYIKDVQLSYFRFPGFQKIKRNDIVVFNWPADTVRYFGDHSGIHVDKPIDKKSNYVKRCVGIPGDSLEIRKGFVYINGKQNHLPDRAKIQFLYTVKTKDYLSFKAINRLGWTKNYKYRFFSTSASHFKDLQGDKDFNSIVMYSEINDSIAEFSTYYRFNKAQMQSLHLDITHKISLNLTREEAEKIKQNPKVISVVQQNTPAGTYDKSIFPNDPQYRWSRDNFGPVYIPEKGAKIKLTTQNLPLYKRIIENYEKNSLYVDNGNIFINGKKTDSYTFKQNYYWMMGDNRHNSEDARFWGYVPFDHVVGKPVFIWFSIAPQDPYHPKSWFKRIRTERLFTTVHGSGKPVSYLYYFLGALAVYFIYSFVKKRKKEA